jgi:hypothetical protein
MTTNEKINFIKHNIDRIDYKDSGIMLTVKINGYVGSEQIYFDIDSKTLNYLLEII